MDELWEQVWAELRGGLSRQPRCAEHPDFPCVRTLSRGAINDIISVDRDGVRVRSHQTSNEDIIPATSFRAWWVHLQQHGNAALDPNDPNCPRSDRAVLVGAIYTCCLPNRIGRLGPNRISMLPPPPGGDGGDFPLPEEVAGEQVVEGAVRSVVVNAYERDPQARRRCIEAHGTRCCICGFSFGVVYGPVAEGYIHVHHLCPLSEVGEAHVVDPVTDLRPVCPNCHAVLHRRVPAFSIEELRWLMEQQIRD
jgi:5-methylcytosine-specific restriction endonuclease McrA